MLLCALYAPPAAQAESRVALVIGNSAYEHTNTLANPANDARLIASILKRQGFEVLAHENLGFKGMKRAIKAFTTKLSAGGRDTVGLMFYAGHGLQTEGVNFLVPVDANIQDESDIPLEAIDAAAVLGSIRIAGNRLNIIILDACRNNPYQGKFRSSVRGLARMDAPIGALVAYSTSPGNVAADGDAANSPYTQALAAAMVQPGLKIEDVFKRTRQAVYDATDGKQVPWESSSVFGDFYFASSDAPAPQDQDAQTNSEALELAFWDAVKDSSDVKLLQSYLDKYPTGTFAPIARSLITKAEKPAATATDRQAEPKAEQKTAAIAPSAFDGLWRIIRHSPSCRRKKAKYVEFQIKIEAGKVQWPRGEGTIDKDGTFKLKSRVISGTRGTYTGQIEGASGKGLFYGENLLKGKTCTGTLKLTRIAE